jgi:hypothetical protein
VEVALSHEYRSKMLLPQNLVIVINMQI